MQSPSRPAPPPYMRAPCAALTVGIPPLWACALALYVFAIAIITANASGHDVPRSMRALACSVAMAKAGPRRLTGAL